MRPERWLLAAIPPCAAGIASATLPGPPAPIDAARPAPLPPCEAPVLDRALVELAGLIEAEAGTESFEAWLTVQLRDTFARCGSDRELLAVDCAAEPCLALTTDGDPDWEELSLCHPLYDLLAGRPLGWFERTLSCDDGPVRLQGIQIALEGGEAPVVGTLAWDIERAIRHERFEALIEDLGVCPPQLR